MFAKGVVRVSKCTTNVKDYNKGATSLGTQISHTDPHALMHLKVA